jgi:hypothetical protein
VSELVILGIGFAVLVLLAKTSKSDGERPEGLKDYISKEIDDLAGTEIVTGWKVEDELVQQFTETYKEAGYTVAESAPVPADLLKILIDLFIKLIGKPKHFLKVKLDDIDRFGTVITAGGSKPLTCAIVFRIALVRGTESKVMNDFIDYSRTQGLSFVVYNVAGQKMTGGLAVGNYFAYAPVSGAGPARLLNELISHSIRVGTNARSYWNDYAICSPIVVVVDKESLLARVDP